VCNFFFFASLTFLCPIIIYRDSLPFFLMTKSPCILYLFMRWRACLFLTSLKSLGK
jgi:hypothetical protein